jgi:hypothetical protein
MRRSSSRSLSGVVGAALALAWSLAPVRARAQACCAGTTAVTPARLAMHETALLGVQLRAASVLGSFDENAHYTHSPSGASEYDFGQDLFGAVRFLGHGQAALLIPLVETRRATRTLTEAGGGIGDVNLSARYDFLLAGESRIVPGVAALAGITFPTGRPPEGSDRPLATDATGVGAFQGNVGLALEQAFARFTVSLTGIVAKRAARTEHGIHETLGTQLTALGAVAYSFDDDSAIAVLASYAAEGDATIGGVEADGTSRRILRVGVAGLHPLSDHWKVLGSLFIEPPIGGLGRNLPASAGLTFTGVYAW